ncbi:MAG: AgmX/PglI C-terminal domain-containing protein [Polyangiaceae bacterium]
MLRLRSIVPVFALAISASACNQPDVDTSTPDDTTAAKPTSTEGASVRVEQAERALDVGRDVAGARATLEGIVKDTSVPADVRERASFALSRAFEAQKDTEGAIRTIESLLAAHAEDRSWPAQEQAEKRLRKLLTGKEDRPSPLRRPEEKVAPVARALAAYFPAKKDGPTVIDLRMFGGDMGVSEGLGTFRIGDALREIADESCPLCDTKVKVQTSSSRSGGWTSIPGERPRLASALTVFYTHLGDPIPARYDDVLPVPMSEVLGHLQKGEGVVIAKERTGAPPSILLAAPREAQLAEVEEAFSKMASLPGSLTVIKVSAGLKNEEIRSTMRANGMPAFKKCYDELLKRSSTATGRTEIAFTIKGDGALDDVHVDATDGLKEGTFQRCMEAAMKTISFPATSQSTTVKYPMTFTP